MHSFSTPPIPSFRSRYSPSSAAQIQQESVKIWLKTKPYRAEVCPVHALTELIATDTSVGRTILGKYDPAKLQSVHALTRQLERAEMVRNTREDVSLRQERAQEWREVMHMAIELGRGDGCEAEAWRALRMTCHEALVNVEELRERLAWCEREFEAGGPATVDLSDKRRFWGKAVTIKLDKE